MHESTTRTLWKVAVLLTLASGVALGQNRPFPQHTTYHRGTIKPQVGQAQMDNAVRSFYDTWKQRYLLPTCTDQYYVDVSDAHPDPLVVSTSEGHGYGMMITALMAGHDPGARTYFDGLYRFFRAHPATGHNDRLMAWAQKQGPGACLQDLETWNATDGELDIAFALLLADKQWGSGGAIDYLQEARNVIAAVMQTDINRSHWTVLQSDLGQSDKSTRTSDHILDHFRSFQEATGNADWSKVIDKSISILQALQTNHAPSTGLLPDFVVKAFGAPEPAAPNRYESPYDGDYYYNACRDPWRLGTDFLLSGDSRVKGVLNRLNTFIRNKTDQHPANIAAGYRLNGSVIGDYTDMVFIAPFGVSAMVDGANQTWLNSLWNLVVTQPSDDYYGSTVTLLSMIVMSGNYWSWSPSSEEPLPDIKANGSDTAITVLPGDRVSVTVSLDPGALEGQDSQWWCVVHTSFQPPYDWYSYVYPSGWEPGLRPGMQHRLFELPPQMVGNQRLPVGDYTFYFGVDEDADDILDVFWKDSVEVHVTYSSPNSGGSLSPFVSGGMEVSTARGSLSPPRAAAPEAGWD